MSTAQSHLPGELPDLAKVEAGKMTFSPEEIDLNQLVGEVRDILRPLVNSKNIHFETEFDTTLNGVVIDPASSALARLTSTRIRGRSGWPAASASAW